MAQSPTIKMRKKMLLGVGSFLLVCFLVLVVNLVNLQLVRGSELQEMATNQQLRDTTVGANRGTIYDRNMGILAKSASVWTVYISPVDITNEQRDLIADHLSEILSVNRESVVEKSKQKNQYATIKRKVEKPEAELVRQFIIDHQVKGIYLSEDSKRFYPQDTLASTILGFAGTDNQGLDGIEALYEAELKGTPGRVVAAKNAWGTDMPFKYQKLYDATDGNSLVLTIDRGVQMFLEQHLEVALRENKVQQKSCGIVMDVQTGEILAMATKPDYDPNAPFEITDPDVKAAIEAITDKDEQKKALSAAQTNQWRNKTVSDLYEPGSVFKIITGSAALEEKAVTPDDRFNCSGSYTLGKETYHCHKLTGHGPENFTDGMKNSCNPVFIEVGQRLGAPTFDKYIKSFGFNEKTGIDLPGEERSVLHKEYTMYDLAGNSFGQTIKITPIQMLTAACASINGGYLYQPHVVQKIIDANGNIIRNIEPNVRRQVISNETSATIRMMLEKVVTEGGGKNAAVGGYRVGGKSGTSQKLDSGDKEARIASFFAFAPADDPKIAVLIICDEPTGDSRFGSMVSAPVAAAVLADTLPYLGIEPEYTAEELASINVSAPGVTEKPVAEAKAALEAKKLKARVIGSGEKVLRQIPAEGSAVPKDGTVILYTDDSQTQQVTVPSFKGFTYTQVKNMAANMNLNIKATGAISSTQSVAAAQDIQQDTVVEAGSVIEVRFQETINSD